MKNNKTKYVVTTQKDAILMIDILHAYFKDAKCGLDFKSPIELVVALILAAQCTDVRVNQIVPILFRTYPDVAALANTSPEEIAKIIKPCGFYHNKSIAIYETANILLANFGGEVPHTMDELTTLRGIGRKSSNIILQECFNHTVGIAVDTHVTRITRKMGITQANSPEKIEEDLMKMFDHSYWSIINHVLVNHGREFCIARRPKCDICLVKDICPKND